MPAPQLTDNSIPLNQWVDELFNRIFYQPDDAVAVNSYKEFISPDFLVRINHNKFTHDQYLGAVKHARDNNTMTLQASDELQTWNAADASGVGCVAQMTRFTLSDKASGKDTKMSSLTIANVQVCDGKRTLVELTEVVLS